MQDFLFRGDLEELDPDVAGLIRHETARQARTLIMIPSESTVPAAVREALGSAFHNIYAEGYPTEESRTLTQGEILDYETRLAEYRRLADARYYKGTEYANLIEALARRRVAEAFATPRCPAEKLYVNVQPLSGAPANSAVYTGLLQVGDTILSMDLLHGGHLSHGSPVARSGKQYKIISYGVDPNTEQIDYDQIALLAQQHRPKIVLGGYTSYPWAPDWARLRQIADSVGAYLMADIAHVAGLVVGGAYPSPVGIADIVTFTTHKTLNGPRGAVIITHRADLSGKLDRGVFPGEQGGPHMNQIAALAVAMRFAATEQFHALQQQTTKNAVRLIEKLQSRGIRVAYGGGNTHLFVIDCRPIVGADGTTLSGETGARILDLVGIVANRQTIPGDVAALRPSGVRFGTPWLTQRGFKEAEMDALGDIIADVLLACRPFSYAGKKRDEPRAKVDFDVLQKARIAVRELALCAGIDTDAAADEYHFPYSDTAYPEGWHTFHIRGERAADFLEAALTADVLGLGQGTQAPSYLLNQNGELIARAIVEHTTDQRYLLHIENSNSGVGYAAAWLRSLSDGLTIFDTQDLYAKVPGPVAVVYHGAADANRLKVNTSAWGEEAYASKAYFVGMNGVALGGAALPAFHWSEPTDAPLLTTPLHALHKALKAKMVPFAGYDMPVWYTSVMDEHLAVRGGCGVFDVTHMGVWDIQGAGAAAFLDQITTNDVAKLDIGDSHYTYLLDVDGVPHDDLMIYRLAAQHFLIVVNASNNDKNWAWVNAVKDGQVSIDGANPARRINTHAPFTLRDLRNPASGADRRVDVALQGKTARDVLYALGASDADKAKLKALPWAGVMQATFGGFDLIISRTGYTGERVAFELFVHPDQAAALFEALVKHGATPCGLAARDSLRTEAGLPLYGHELGGDHKLNPADAGFSGYVKLWKPFFIGKAAFVAHEHARDAEVARFRLENKGVRPPHAGDVLLDKRGRVVGVVTSCSVDSEGYQLGLAYLKHSHNEEGTQLGVFAARNAKNGHSANLGFGDKVALPEPAVVVSRFAKLKK
jgi:glycine hydroxymethyltransferase